MAVRSCIDRVIPRELSADSNRAAVLENPLNAPSGAVEELHGESDGMSTPGLRSSSHCQLLERIRGEFLEMPGLAVTPTQAQRLWAISADLCADVLGELVRAEFLVRLRDGRYARSPVGES
jgi:hypothetical protein